MVTTTRTRKPTLSLVVPRSDEPRGPLLRRDSAPLVDDAQTSLKHKRLFPVACRVVPTDQWFTSRVDRTWTVLDLKLWLLSKALPTATLPLPAAFRPSSPVTFAVPPPRPQTASSYRTNGDDDGDGDDEAGDNNADDDDDGPSSPISSPSSPSASDTHRTPRSIPYSFSTGAPAISGLDALKSHARARPELVTNAEAIAHLWRVYSFSAGILLADDLPLAEYNILPFELLELHRFSAYVRLPRPLIPHPYTRSPDDPSDEEDDDDGAPSRAVSSRAYPAAAAAAATAGFPARKPSPPEPRPMSNTDTDPSAAYTQPYFDGWLCVLTNPHASEQQQQQADDPTRKRARAKSDARSRDKASRDREREWSELQKLLVGVADAPVPPPPDPVSRWRRRWVMLRSGMLSIWRERRDPRPETEWEVASCVALHDADKIPSILGSSAAAAPSEDHVVCARFRTPPTTHYKNKPPRTPTPLSPWLVLKLPDASTREHLLRTIHRLAYPAHPPTRARTAHRPRTLRTAFLPNPIPHPLALSFSQPPRIRSPRALSLSPDLSSPSTPSSPSSSTLNGSDDGPSAAADAQDNTMGLGSGMGVRFPEWREFVLRRAVRAGQGFPPSSTPTSTPPSADNPYGFSRAERPYLGGADFNVDDDDDADSDALSEREWDGWAYDLDRPRGTLPEAGGGGMKTPHGSPVEREDDAEVNVEVEVEVAVEIDQGRRRAQSVVGAPGVMPTPTSSVTSGDTLSPPLSPLRSRSATVSASEDPAAHAHAGRMRGLMRGLSMRAGRDSFMRSLENALDFVEGK